MVTARIEEIDELVGFESGADDYIKKPFTPICENEIWLFEILQRKSHSGIPERGYECVIITKEGKSNLKKSKLFFLIFI
mgnify:CR=1 FL=1